MTKSKMIRKMFSLAMVLVMALTAQAALAESAADPNAAARDKAVAAMKVSMPEAELNYALRERDDGRWQWELFFSQGASMGVCKVLEDSNTIRKVELYDKAEGALTADQAVQKLMSEKGASAIVELDLDREGGELYYEGECEVGGRRYEFEMADDGSIIEWERD